MKTARQILIDELNMLMLAKGWSVRELCERTGSSRAWVTKLLKAEVNFTIDEYEKLLVKGFELSFEFVASGLDTSAIPREYQDLHGRLATAIEAAAETGSLTSVRFIIGAIAEKTIADRELLKKMRGDKTG